MTRDDILFIWMMLMALYNWMSVSRIYELEKRVEELENPIVTTGEAERELK
jgi:hypothetical protein